MITWKHTAPRPRALFARARWYRYRAKEVVALGAVGAVPAGLGVVTGGAIPYQDWALEQRDENRANWLDRDPEIKCFLPGIPRATYMPYPFQIVQNEEVLFFSYEYAGAVRNVALSDPGPAPVDSWMGQSWARWEGDTLVIETNGLNAETWLDRAGNFHSEALKVTERFSYTSSNTINYEATLEDDKVFTRPLDDSHDLVSTGRTRCTDHAVQLCRVCGGVDVWRTAQGTIGIR